MMLKRERKAIAAMAGMEAPEIEVNNAAGLHLRAARARTGSGPFMNAYNEATIDWMARTGRDANVCLPCELPAEAIGRRGPGRAG